jgi:hypothetical protein
VLGGEFRAGTAYPRRSGTLVVCALTQSRLGYDFAYAYANGAPITTISQGTAFFHDFAPGTYVIAVDNCQPGSQRTLTVSIDASNDFALQVQQGRFWAA